MTSPFVLSESTIITYTLFLLNKMLNKYNSSMLTWTVSQNESDEFLIYIASYQTNPLSFHLSQYGDLPFPS